MLKIPKKGCGSSEEEGGAQHHVAPPYCQNYQKPPMFMGKYVLTGVMKRSTEIVLTV